MDHEFVAAIAPTPESGLGFGSWWREITEAARATLSKSHFPSDVPHGNGETVLLIPGFLAGDWTMHPLRDFLRRLDYRVEFAGVTLNLGPTKGFLPHLERTMVHLYERTGEPVIVIGQSLGGAFARALAHRHPEKLSHVVTMASPIHFPVVTPLQSIIRLLAPFHGPDLEHLRDEILASPRVPVTALYSQDDGIVDWRCCLQDESATCRNIEVSGAHSAMGFNPAAQAAIARALAQVRQGRGCEEAA